MSTDDDTRRAALARSIGARISDARRSLDELRVFDEILTRVCDLGHDAYGPLNLTTDRRDFRLEAGAELADALWYLACLFVARRKIRAAPTEERFDLGGES